MNQRDTRSYGDSHSSRKPDYDTGVQGRFGRQEDWRKVEREQAAHKLTLREQVELEAAEQKRASREAAQRRAAEQQRRRQMAQQQAAEERLRRQQQEERRQRSKPSEPEQTIQGRFGRQEVRLNPEREARRQAAQQARQYDRQRYVTHERQQQAQQLRQPQQPTASREQPRAQRPVRQTPTQVEAQRQAQQRAQRQAAQEQVQRRAQQQAAQQQWQVQQAHDEQQPRQGQRKQSVQEMPDDQAVRSAHGGRHMPVVQRDRQVASRPQVQHEQQDPWQIDQGDLQQEPPVDTTVAQVPQDIDQQAQPWAQQQSRTSTYRPSFGDADAASRYARESYGSNRKQGSYTVNSVGQSAKSKFDRRPNIERTSGERSRSGKKLLSVSPKLIVVIAIIFVIVIVVSVLNPFAQTGDTDTGQTGGTVTTAAAQPSLPTPIMSESSGITMHSAVAMEDLTEILIHNASYAYANEITTQLAEAKNTDILAAHGTGRVASEQPTGDNWMTGEFIRCFREGNAGPVMSAIDCGGPVGATVYAPVTGEVVLVKQYKLYDEINDYRIHIQPEGRPDLDVVLIHLTDVTVKPGDKVTAGVTPMAKIRDIFQYLDESLQLKNYTAENDNGNHTHIQVNNATHPEYHGLDDLKPQPATSSDGATPTTDA